MAVSVRNLENLNFPDNHSFVDDHRRALSAIRGATDAPVVVGGGGVAVAAESFLAAIGGDVAVIGEGEQVLCDIAVAVEESGGLPRALRAAVLVAPPLEDPGGPGPDRRAAGEPFYVREGGCATVQTKRGCDLACTYCTYPLIEGTTIRLRDCDAVVEEMAGIVADTGCDHFTIVDAIFNNPEEHAMAFCEALLRRKLEVKWTAYFRPVHGAREFFRLLSLSGCHGIDATPDSLSPRVLDALGKGFDASDVERFCDGARAEGLLVNLNLIIGGPDEDKATFRETMDGIERCRPKSAIFGLGVRLYPRSALSRTLVARGAIDGKEIGVEPVYYFSERLPPDFLSALGERAKADGRLIVPGLGIRYNPLFFRRLRAHGKKGPVWRLL